MIRAVFFDAGNTLIHPHPGVAHVCAEVFQRHGLNATVETLFDAVQAAESFYEERYKTDDSFWASETRAEDFWIAYYTNVARCWG
ncbi:MAG: hypothetical protein M1335_05320, partial [Chloroflexi bacterium]|nr:hypothetical protein [Chloroflexota bacterium]